VSGGGAPVRVSGADAWCRTVKGMRAAAAAILAATGPEGIDYLVRAPVFASCPRLTAPAVHDTERPADRRDQDHRGRVRPRTPRGAHGLTRARRIEQGFAVQAVSRFALAHLLAHRGALRTGAAVVSVANTGRDAAWLDVADLSLVQRAARGRWAAGLFLDQSFRDSCVLDAVHLELNARHPRYAFYHLHPGIVRSEGFAAFTAADVPFPFGAMLWAGRFVAADPDEYAALPVYVAVCAADERAATLGADRFLDWKLKTVVPGAWARDAHHRAALWATLEELVGAP
jgi:hypothetical protein